MTKNDIKKYITEIMDFPTKGIGFKDISLLLGTPEAFNFTIDELAKHVKQGEKILSPDARGFIFGTPVAYKVGVPFVMVRKPGKLPGQTISETYDLEYGKNELQIQKNALKKGDKVVIIDDILATGGTVNAMIKLVETMGATVSRIVFLAELSFINGREKLLSKNVESLVKYD